MDLAQIYRFRLDWIASFVAVARYGGFSAAAAALYRSQPRVSIHVAELERALGVKLFDRSVHPAVLTPEGRAALPHAEAVLHHVHELCNGAAADGSVRGDVRLAIYPSAAAFLIPDLLVELRQAHPHVKLALREGPTMALDELLLAGEADLAVRPVLPPVGSEKLAHAVLWHEPLVAVVGQRHPLATQTFVELDELAGMALITIGEGEEQASSQFETNLVFEQAGLSPQVVFRTNQPQTLVALVRRGLGIGVTNGLAMTTSNLDGVRLVRIADAHCEREVALWWRTDQSRSLAVSAVHEIICGLPEPSLAAQTMAPSSSSGGPPFMRSTNARKPPMKATTPSSANHAGT
ncbi:LysR family transcriptional regulator [Actinopolymorpha alba]|uniref:LysR family transcriptional regulator n=1 Tax=Actinopolymorpha alba TaxID=533267 RepID=UPI0003A48F2C|nr:LysR family transcriptional regulator [Actinopolymorpha alba]